MPRPTRASLRFMSLALALVLAATSFATPAAANDLVLIFDASGSMWGQVDGENKIVIARRVLADVVADLPDDAEVGLVAYGHRREGDCTDIETLVPLGPLDRDGLKATVNGLNPKGKTPITASAESAFALLEGREESTTVVLLSDGLETCDGDPCAAVKAAMQAGAPFVFHVIGFDVAKEDVSSLECAAQAGGGLYLAADDADGLASALDQAVATEVPPGRLSLTAIADGALIDASVRVVGDGGVEAAGGRTYASPETNPRILHLADGTYKVEVFAVGLEGDTRRSFEIEIVDGGLVEKTIDFSTGELSVAVTRNGAPSDATVRVTDASTARQVAATRTYTGERTNPAVFRLTVGKYLVNVKSVEIRGAEVRYFDEVTVSAGAPVALSHDFASATLKVKVVASGDLADATLRVVNRDRNQVVATGRSYTSESSNPRTFVVPPGTYEIHVKGVRREGNALLEVDLEPGAAVELTADIDT